MGRFDASGMKGSACLSEGFSSLIERAVFNQVSSFIFLQVMAKQPTMRDFCFHMRCKALQFVTLNGLVQKAGQEANIKYLEKYLDGVVQKLKTIDDGGSLFLLIQCIEQSLILISDLFLIVLGSKNPAGSEVHDYHSGHTADLSVLFHQGWIETSSVYLQLHRPDDDSRRS